MIDSSARPAGDDIEVEQMYAQVRRGLFGARDAPVRVGRYEIVERIGAGAMGFVYAGRDAALDRTVAVKLLRPDAFAAGRGSRGRARLLREAQAMAQVSSPFAVGVFEAGTHGDQVFVAMEYVPGQTLTQWLTARAHGWREVVALFAQAGRGLAAVHAAGLVHRDFKPDNVLIGDDGRPRVADFGLAAAAGQRDASRGGGSPGNTTDVRLTRTGVAAGSLAYMSPEQHRRESVSARSDQFGFCVALFEALFEVRPFAGETEDDLVRNVLAGTIGWPKPGPRVPARIVRLLRRGLALSPTRRFASMEALVRELERALHRNRAYGLAAAAATGGVLWALLAGAWEEAEPGPCELRRGAVDGAWNPERADALGTALRGAPQPYAAATARQVTAQIDDYAARWSTVLDGTCSADGTAVAERQLLTLACLDRGLSETTALVAALTDEPDRLVGHATIAAYKLRDPAACADEPSLVLRGAASRDPQSAAARGRVWSAIDEAAVRLHAGDYGAGLTSARAAEQQARALGDDALVAEALVLRGTLAAASGRYADAERDLFEAAVVAERAAHFDVLARARTELVIVVGYRQGRAQEAAVWAALADAALRQHEAAPLVEVRLLNARGLVARQRGEPAAARGHLRDALALARDALGGDHPGLAATLENIASLDADAGDATAARQHLAEALAIRQATLGVDHPDTARTQGALQRLD